MSYLRDYREASKTKEGREKINSIFALTVEQDFKSIRKIRDWIHRKNKQWKPSA